jgi:hypothetical protein
MTAKPKPMPTTPHELCTRLTELGDSFWIERRQPGTFAELDPPEMLDVRDHSPEWVELCRQGDNERFFWIRWCDLGPFTIVES